MDFKGKRVIITGGSSGIGLEMARELHRRGARLGLLARDEARLREAAETCDALYASGDVTDADSTRRAIEQLATALGGLDGIIANSGYCHPGYFHAIGEEDAARQIDTNLTGVVRTLQPALPYLMRAGGFIAMTSSPAGHAAVYGFSLYGATKAGLNQLAHTLRHEYRDYDIRVHVLLPPDTDTPGYRHEVTLYPPETRAVLSGGSLLRAEDVAHRMIEGIARGKNHVAVGTEARALLPIVRYAPWIWDIYTRWQVRRAKRAREEPI